jgi:hypothetical protein
MSMTTYLPFYSKKEAGAPALASDPACVLYLPLWKKDALINTSDDKYGHIFTRMGPISTPKGWYFDGVDDYGYGPSTPILCPAEAITVIVWANQTALNDNAVLVFKYSCDWSTYFNGWRFYAAKSGTMDFTSSDGTYPPLFNSSLPSGAITQGIWNMYAATYDRVKIRYYLNGLPLSSVNYTRAINIYAGAMNLGWGFKGTQGEVLEFTRALSAVEINDYCLATKWRYL